jgi:endonuclease YncB( thermonuclease family)
MARQDRFPALRTFSRQRLSLRRLPLRSLLMRRPVLWVAIVLAIVLLRWFGWLEMPPQAPPGPLKPGIYQVQRVVDGDTLRLTNGHPVRLIGADTPETVKPNWPVEPWGPEATEFTRQFVAGGQIRLQFDGRRTDKYERVLAHVWVGEQMLGEELIRAGLATAVTKYDYDPAVKARLQAAENQAKAARLGIWSN